MKKIVYAMSVLSTAFFLAACSGNTDTAQNETTTDSSEQVAAPATVIDATKVYSFMELKELYAKDWQGEEEGNSALDGKVATITGEVFSSGKISALKDDGSIGLKGFNMKFRGGKFSDPDFGHDVECIFPAELAAELESIKKGTNVTVKGTIEKQELYIESETFQYHVLTLKDCNLVK